VETRLAAVADLLVPEMREGAGIHTYDGVVQDLSPAGVRAGLARLGGPARREPHDEAHLAAMEEHLRVFYGELEEHRRNPLVHLDNLDLAVYDKTYAPEEVRAEARRRHAAAWPFGVEVAIEALDRVPAAVAAGLLGAVRGLAAGLPDDLEPEVHDAAVAAVERLVAHLEHASEHGPADAALGSEALARLLSSAEAIPVDLRLLARRADDERDRLRAMLDEACERLRPGAAPGDLVAELLRDHPGADGVLDEARAQVAEVIEFTRARDLVPGLDGECRVGPAPPSRRWAMAMMTWAGPYEDDAPSWYHVTPPDESWPAEEQEQWLEVFSRTTLPAITVHEVAPGHFAHGRALRRAPSDVRRTLYSGGFIEGWAHYTEELCLDEGFRADDPRFAIGVAIEALVRVTRLAVSIGFHTREMTLDDAAARFEADAFLQGPAARGEANRATFDPTYGRYTWGKLEILSLRDEAEMRWGKRYSHTRFHAALLDLGAPPLGLIGDALGVD
jgi:hypothetical protein